MTAVTPVDAALSVSQRIGRYFSLVSLIPSLFLVLWIYVLVLSGAPSGRPSVKHVTTEFLIHGWVATTVTLVLASFAVAIVLHPLQFATTQLLEGYWGTTPLAAAAMKIRIIHHRKRSRELLAIANYNERTWRAHITDEQPELLGSRAGDPLMDHVMVEQLARARLNGYPSDERILPTQLGNALRRFEDAAGNRYGLDAISVSPHLHLVAPDRHLDYLRDAREDMDTAIRICTIGLLATVLTVGFFLTDGSWLLWAMLPYAVSYLTYKGAVSAAENYGAVFSSVIDLDRFVLYDALGLYPPRDTVEEKETNTKLMSIWAGKTVTEEGEEITLPYRRKDAVVNRSRNLTQRKRISGIDGQTRPVRRRS